MAQPRETTHKDRHGRIFLAPSPSETIIAERQYCPFDKRRLTFALHGGEKNVLLKEKFMTEFSRDPRFRLDDIHELTLDQVRQRTMAKMHSLVHYVTTEPLDVFNKRVELIGTLDPAFNTRWATCQRTNKSLYHVCLALIRLLSISLQIRRSLWSLLRSN